MIEVKKSLNMRVIFIVCWLASLVIADSGSDLDVKTYGCQLLPVVKTLPSQLYADECTLTIPTWICGGFCESSVEPFRARKKKNTKDVYEIQFKEDCSCCSPVANRLHTAKIEAWKLDCIGGKERNETVTLQWPTSCSCTGCRGSSKLG